MSKKNKAKKSIKIDMTPSELTQGLYSTACLAYMAGKAYGGGAIGAGKAIITAQEKAKEITSIITVANRLYSNAKQ